MPITDVRQVKNLPEILLNMTEAIKNLSGNGVLKYWGEANTYADLPAAPQEGAIYKVLTEDVEHGISAGSRVIFFEGKWMTLGSSGNNSNA